MSTGMVSITCYLNFLQNYDGIALITITLVVVIQLILCCVKKFRQKDDNSSTYTDLKIELQDPHMTPEFLSDITFTGPNSDH